MSSAEKNSKSKTDNPKFLADEKQMRDAFERIGRVDPSAGRRRRRDCECTDPGSYSSACRLSASQGGKMARRVGRVDPSAGRRRRRDPAGRRRRARVGDASNGGWPQPQTGPQPELVSAGVGLSRATEWRSQPRSQARL